MLLKYTKQCLIITFIIVITTTLLWLLTVGIRKATAKESNEGESLTLPFVVVHLDFKGMPPHLSYLKSILPKIRKLGANGLLLEYEDMFPYEGKLKNLSSEYAYTKQELSGFLSFAHDLGFEIIPLVQTFGHFEFTLKLPEFRHLRENPLYPDSICPTKQESQDLIKDMLRQVIEFHNNIFPLNHMHIGCDEVYNINVCEDCKIRKQSDLQLFVAHVNNVYGILKSISPNVTVLIWDDMIRIVRSSNVKIINELLDVEPVYWDYRSVILYPDKALFYYKSKFKNTWIATAFKGADGRTNTVPNITARYGNNYNRLKLMFDFKHMYKFKGIILTGWSRYGHMDPPCELLPASIPSLTLNLFLVKRFKDGLEVTSFKTLSEEEFYEKYLHVNFGKELSCNFNNRSHIVYGFIHHCNSDLIQLLLIYDEIQANILKYYFKGGMDTVDYYYNNYNTVSPHSLTYKTWALKSLRSLHEFTVLISNQSEEYYDKHFIQEYLYIKSYYLRKILNRLYSRLHTCKSLRLCIDNQYIFRVPKR